MFKRKTLKNFIINFFYNVLENDNYKRFFFFDMEKLMPILLQGIKENFTEKQLKGYDDNKINDLINKVLADEF